MKVIMHFIRSTKRTHVYKAAEAEMPGSNLPFDTLYIQQQHMPMPSKSIEVEVKPLDSGHAPG